MLKIENKAAWEEKDKVILLHSPVKNEGLIDGNRMNVHSKDASIDVLSTETRLIENKTEIHANGAVTQIKLPKVIVCFDDDARQIVKDICIDDGLHSREKFLLESNDATDEVSSDLKASSTKADDDLDGPIKDGTRTLKDGISFISLMKDRKDQNTPWGLSEFGENKNRVNQVTTDGFNQKFSLEQLLSLGKPDTDPQPLDFASFSFNTDRKQRIDEKNVEELIVDEVSSIKTSSTFGPTKANPGSELKDTPPNNMSSGTLQEEFSTTSSGAFDVKVSKRSSETKEVCSNLEVESGVTNPQVKSAVAANGREQSEENIGNQQFAQGTAPEGTASARSSFYQNNFADLHLSGPSYLAGPKISSGHIAYSGSISLRSDSSTTSTRSFAFPVLQPEWNSSPVKMAKADRRYIGKHRRLKTVLFCCKF